MPPSPPATTDDWGVGSVASFSVQDEGGITGLYLSAWDLGGLSGALDLPDDDVAIVLHDDRRTPVPWAMVGLLSGTLELVHLDGQTAAVPVHLPSPLLADPARAVPARSRLAISAQHDGPVVIYSRDPALLGRCLGGFVAAYLGSVVGADAELPSAPEPLLTTLAAPQAPGVSTALHLRARRRFWTLDLVSAGEGVPEERSQWVCEGPGGRWRAGWSW